MQGILFEYEINPTTWVYLSSLMTIGIYFKFRRFWSMRNLDLVGLIAFSPGLLLVYHGLARDLPLLLRIGYVWLFAVGGCFLARLLLDSMMVRRPLLEPNLSAGGLTFTGLALLFFLMANIVTNRPAHRLEHVLSADPIPAEQVPGYAFFYYFAKFPDQAIFQGDAPPHEQQRRELVRLITVKTTAILGHLAIVLGIVLVSYRHFGNLQTGVAAATLYLLLPYTAQLTGRVGHVVPGALMVWAIEAYRRPMLAGLLLGLGSTLMAFPWGVGYYPLFLLPLWCSFYAQRGWGRFLIGVAIALLLVMLPLALSAENPSMFIDRLRAAFALASLAPDDLVGFWQFFEPVYRLPVIVAFAALCMSLALWPAQKNLGTLLSCSAAVILGTQFWKAHEGGLYMAWYLPLLILTIFRPNLEDRVAISTVRETRRKRKKKPQPAL